MALSNTIEAALLRLVQDRGDSKAVEVTSYHDSTAYGGYCDTCSYEYAVVDIYYRRADNTSGTYRYDGGFSELIYTLDNYS